MTSSTSSVTQRVINSVVEWLSSGDSVWLCTVVRTWGSSPRPAGSLMAFHPSDGLVGSLSGGCLEEDLVTGFADAVSTPHLVDYAITEDDQLRYRLPCGGEVSLLIEKLDPSENVLNHFISLQEKLVMRIKCARQVSLTGEALRIDLNPKGEAVMLSNTVVSVAIGPSYRLLLVGAGEVAHYVAEFAKTLDFSVTLCEPRELFLKGWDVCDVDVVKALPDDLVKQRFNDDHCAILALAHDPRVDDMCLMEALKTQAFYVGAMGSLATSLKRRERLKEFEITQSQLEKLHAPVGVSIGSKRPPEIAISIMAELISARQQTAQRLPQNISAN